MSAPAPSRTHCLQLPGCNVPATSGYVAYVTFWPRMGPARLSRTTMAKVGQSGRAPLLQPFILQSHSYNLCIMYPVKYSVL